jgi:hypothetical protein
LLLPQAAPSESQPVANLSPERAAALQAAAVFYEASVVAGAEACKRPARLCVATYGRIDSPALGVVAVSVTDPEFGGAIAFFGRRDDGSWAYWFSTQNDSYQATSLPAQMRVCADGQGANLRMTADAGGRALSVLRDGAIVTAESFVLTQPGSSQPLVAGLGWYRLSAPAAGFVRSDLLSVTRFGDCSVRDIQVR